MKWRLSILFQMERILIHDEAGQNQKYKLPPSNGGLNKNKKGLFSIYIVKKIIKKKKKHCALLFFKCPNSPRNYVET
jgi:hypothetical protein